jgi:hypothetical protein
MSSDNIPSSFASKQPGDQADLSQPPLPPNSSPTPHYPQPAFGAFASSHHEQNPHARFQYPLFSPPFQTNTSSNKRQHLKTWQIIAICIGSSLLAGCCLLSILGAAFANKGSSSSQTQAYSSSSTTTQQPRAYTSTVIVAHARPMATPKPTATPKPVLPTATPLPPTPTPAPQWVTTQVFQGSQSEKSQPFTTQNQWRIQWACDPWSNDLGSYNVITDIYVVYPDGEKDYYDNGVNEICDSSNTSGTSNHYFDPGDYILDIITDGAYTFSIQEWESQSTVFSDGYK